MRRIWDAIRGAASWVVRPPDFEVCRWANLTDTDKEPS